LGDLAAEWLIFAVPAVAIAFGWHNLFQEKTFATWIVDFLFAFAFGILLRYFTIALMRGLSLSAGFGRRSRPTRFPYRLANWHVRLHGVREFLSVSPSTRNST
jgi:hypothetical protein